MRAVHALSKDGKIMPGVPVSHLTPAQFKLWKEQKELEKEQVKRSSTTAF